MSKIKNKSRRKIVIYSSAILTLVILFSFLSIWILDNEIENTKTTSGKDELSNMTAEPIPTPEPTPEPPEFIDISLLSAGDIMFHTPQLISAYNDQTKTYNFMNYFQYVKPYISAADYAVANLETTLAGTDTFEYTGSVVFNTPDSALDPIKDAGFDMLLLANNHIYDTKELGLLRTQQKVREYGFDYIGAREDQSEKSYMIKDIKGIKIGFINYTYQSSTQEAGKVYINAIALKPETVPLLDSFDYDNKQAVYDEVAARVTEMRNQGADIIILYIHWGNEYNLVENDHQDIMAQNFCDAGVDIIIGGHPHVEQPIKTVVSTDGLHQTLCAYSLGNFISNQKREENLPLKTGATEDGVMLTFNIRKLRSGETYVKSIDYIPTWVNRVPTGGNMMYDYQVLPLPMAINFPSKYGLDRTSDGISRAQESQIRTDGYFKQFVTEYNEYEEKNIR
ncbi:MAG: CapA family protein [Clostridiales bacterium]|jgi:poly-gamma-glutamate synthesis protein (capsule biosynthesis protein)|nr:CapA family protein [Clostridiales bacterium]